MDVGSIATREVDLADLGKTAAVAAQRMLQRNVGTLVVRDSHRRPIGILTDRDLTLRVLAKGIDGTQIQVQDVFTASPRRIPERASIGTALAMMRETGVRRLPVVDDDDRLVGLIALDDIVALLCEEAATIGAVLAKEGPRTLSVT